ncbi:MAG: glycosyltransferase family 4 protein [Rhodocyclaceae bacterium]|nr:glycosyltransferase family 4 protein [Rhodocyclaceae bacterium]
MKILVIASLFPPHGVGGAEAVAERMSLGLAGRGHQVVVVTLAEPGGKMEIVEREGLQIIRIPLVNLYGNLDAPSKHPAVKIFWHVADVYNAVMGRKLEKLIRETAPDIICVHNLAGFSAAIYEAARRCGAPLVQVLHDHYFLCPFSICYRRGRNCATPCLPCRLVRFPHQRLTESASAVVGVSRFILEKVTGLGMFPGVPKAVIHNAREMTALAKAQTGSARIFGYLGALVPHKGVEQLIQAFQSFSGDGISLVIAGSGTPQYTDHLRYISGTAPIEFIGQSRPERFFQLIDVLIVPSLCAEAFSLVAAESCLAGVPVIAARRGGLPEVIEDGHNGILFDPESPGALVACIRKLIDEPNLFHRLQANTCRSAIPFGDIEGWLSKYEGILQSALAHHLCGERPR